MKKFIPLCMAAVLPILPAAAEVKLSERLARIAGHLGDGGVHFSVTDSKDDLKNIGEFIDKVIEAVPEAEVPPGLKVEALFDDLGLYSIEGRGSSSHQIGDLWHNRSFILTDGTHKAALSLLGDEADTPVAHDFAPAGADLILETSLNLREIERTANKIGKAFGREAEEEIGASLKEQVTSLGLSLADIFADFTVHGTVVFWLDDEKTFELNPETKLPVPHFAARLDNAGIVWKLLKSELGEGSVIIEKGDDVILTPKDAKEDSPFGPLEPRFVWNSEKKQLFFSLTESDLAACRGGGERVTGDADFKAATAGLPEKTSGLVYASKELFALVVELANEFSSEVPPEAEGLVKELMPYVEKLAKEGGYAAAFAVEEDGFLFAANLPYPVKGEGALLGLGGLASVATLGSLGAAGFTKATSRAQEITQINQMKMLAIAQLEYQAEKGKYASSIEQLIAAGILERELAMNLDGDGVMFTISVGGKAGKGRMLAFLQSHSPKGDVIVAFADGSVQVLSREALEELMGE